MKWAYNVYNNNSRISPEPKLRACCPLCKQEVIAKCGKIKVWHWAHKSNKDCDDWYEPESEWHKGWKDHFPKECQEVSIGNHRADIQTAVGEVIELQNSPISSKKVEERENFYNNMIWVLNGKTFGKNVDFNFKKGVGKWSWMPSIIKTSNKPLFVDFENEIIKINSVWKFKKRTYFNYFSYSLRQFLHIYGNIYDKYLEATKINNGNLQNY